MPQESHATVTDPADEVPIDEALRASWRQRLLRELESTVGPERGRSALEVVHDESVKIDVSDQQALELERDVDLLLDGDSGVAAEAIREALDRLDEGTFGRCVDCGDPIGTARLAALPYAARCLDCQSRAERRR